MDTLYQFVYYYPPTASLLSTGPTPYNLTYISNNLLFVQMSFNTGFIGDSDIVDVFNQKTATIYVTPEGFIAWYQQENLEQYLNYNNYIQEAELIYNSYTTTVPSSNYYVLQNDGTSTTMTFTNSLDFYLYQIKELGMYFVKYDSNYTANYIVSSGAIDPVTQYGLTSNELYMAIIPEALATSPVSILYNSLQTSSQTFSSTVSSQEEQAIYNQSPAGVITSTLTEIGNTLSSIPADIGNAAKNIASSPLTYLIIGAVALVAGLLIIMAVKK